MTTYQILLNPASGAPYEFLSVSRFGSLLVAVVAHLLGFRVWRVRQGADADMPAVWIQDFDPAPSVLPRIAGLFWVFAPDSW